MSPSSSVTPVDPTPPINNGQKDSGIASKGPSITTSSTYGDITTDYLHQPKPHQPPPLARHYATLQEHADSVAQADQNDSEAITPRHEGRRGSFAWGLRAAYDDETPKHCRNPMMPERTNTSTPPSMEELVRRSTIENGASGTRKPSLMHSDTAASHTSATQTPTARFSISTDIDNLTRSDTGRLSVSTLARSMTKVIPDVRMHRPHVGKVAERTTEQNLEETEELSSVQGGKKSRRLSYQSLSGSKMITSPELPQKPPLVIEEAPVCEFHAKPGSQDKSPKCGGLAERRKVKMDLTLPTRLPDLSDQTHSPPGHLMSSITPSRPRSLRPLGLVTRSSIGVVGQSRRLSKLPQLLRGRTRHTLV